MKIYPEDYNVTLSVGFTDLNNEPVILTDLRAVLYDGEDQVVVDFGSLPFDQAAGKKDIIIPGAFNDLADGSLEASRVLRIELVTAAGTIRRSFSYVVASEFRLAIMVNSFMTMEAAELMERSTPNLTGWAAADEDQRYSALIEAFNRLTRIPMRFRDTADDRDYTAREALIYRAEKIITRDAWADVDEAEFLTFPAEFRKALRTAQMIEANEILEGDEIARRHRAGIISETVGESSMMLRGGQIDYGVSSLALKALAGHIYFNHRVVRA